MAGEALTGAAAADSDVCSCALSCWRRSARVKSSLLDQSERHIFGDIQRKLR